jgi:histidinol-phosphate/aromatic aminotransferase/cobyric acid decarboxylase-like protein
MTQPSTSTASPHGGDGLRVAAELGLDPAAIIDLSASLNPFAPDTARIVKRVLDEHPETVTTYPDPTHATDALAFTIDVDPDRLVLTNGGAEAIALVAQLERAGSIVEPEFSLYRRHLSDVGDDKPRWRSNPSNPLGRLAASGDDARVWDEAFFPLATGTWSRGDVESWRLGSLTKLWSCPGLRFGYVIAPTTSAADELRDRQPRWSVNGLALAAVPELLALTDLRGWHASIEALRTEFSAALVNMGYDVRDTDASWILVHHHSNLRSQLASFGVVVRDCTSFDLHGVYRVALPRVDRIELVLDSFAAVAATA